MSSRVNHVCIALSQSKYDSPITVNLSKCEKALYLLLEL